MVSKIFKFFLISFVLVAFSMPVEAKEIYFNSVQFLADPVEPLTCENVPQIYEIGQLIFGYIKLIVPLLLILFITIDFSKAVMSSNAEEMKKAQKTAVIRAVAGIAIFFLPDIIDLVLKMSGIFSSTCDIN